MTFKTLLVLALLAGTTARSAPLSFTQTQAVACLDYNISQNNCSSAFSGTLSAGSETLHFIDVATSNFGVMHVSTSDSFTVANDQAWSYGFVAFQDSITIHSATHEGQAGFVTLGYHIDGTVSATGVSDAFNQVVMRVFNPNLQNWVDDFHLSTGPAGLTLTHQFAIVYGQPFTLYFSMQATGGTAVDSGQGYSFVSKSGSGTSAVNFADTLTLTQLTTLDSNHGAISDSTFVSDSATVYTQSGVVPEPAMLFPGAIGLIMFALLRFKQR
jgi:hypothetical protein